MEKEKKQVVIEKSILNDLQELYPEVSQLSKVINIALREHVEKEQLKRKQEERLKELSKEIGVPKDFLQAHLIERALNGGVKIT